jgi:hypothetical protein
MLCSGFGCQTVRASYLHVSVVEADRELPVTTERDLLDGAALADRRDRCSAGCVPHGQLSAFIPDGDGP